MVLQTRVRAMPGKLQSKVLSSNNEVAGGGGGGERAMPPQVAVLQRGGGETFVDKALRAQVCVRVCVCVPAPKTGVLACCLVHACLPATRW